MVSVGGSPQHVGWRLDLVLERLPVVRREPQLPSWDSGCHGLVQVSKAYVYTDGDVKGRVTDTRTAPGAPASPAVPHCLRVGPPDPETPSVRECFAPKRTERWPAGDRTS